ncbi:MAG: methyltransferase [Desulfurococcaceae archaeon]
MRGSTRLPRLEYVGDVYRPSDDTWLLLGVIERGAFQGKLCLDIGAGSGILGIYALLNGTCERAVFLDVMEDAVESTKMNTEINGVHHRSIVVLSDAPVIGEATIDICFANPPYLPVHDHHNVDVATEGGPGGYETAVYFVDFASKVLKRGGRLYLAYSSLSKPEIIEGVLGLHGFKVNYVERKHFFYETIYAVECVKL